MLRDLVHCHTNEHPQTGRSLTLRVCFDSELSREWSHVFVEGKYYRAVILDVVEVLKLKKFEVFYGLRKNYSGTNFKLLTKIELEVRNT